MRSVLSRMAGAVTALTLAVALTFGPVVAQDAEFKQIKLTEKQVQSFISAQNALNEIANKLQGASDGPDTKLQAELEALAKKSGFANFEEMDDVAANISMVIAGIDPKSGDYTDPVEAIKKEIEDIKADKSIPDKDKKQMLEEMQEALDSTPPLKFPENIELVKKHRADIEKVLQ
ncbi:hypothetical protein ACO2I3_09455 [Leptospira interrogans]